MFAMVSLTKFYMFSYLLESLSFSYFTCFECLISESKVMKLLGVCPTTLDNYEKFELGYKNGSKRTIINKVKCDTSLDTLIIFYSNHFRNGYRT